MGGRARAALTVELMTVAGGMARRLTRYELAWEVGNGRGVEVRRDAIRVFWGGMQIA
jgi:hypothetical protein